MRVLVVLPGVPPSGSRAAPHASCRVMANVICRARPALILGLRPLFCCAEAALLLGPVALALAESLHVRVVDQIVRAEVQGAVC